MRNLPLVLGFLFLLRTAAQADEGIPTPVIQAIKAATVFVKVKVEGRSGSGSGFVVKTDGADAYVVTNHHVIEPKLVELLMVPDRRPGVRPPVPRRSIGPRPTPHAVPPSYTPRFIVHSFKNAEATVVFYSGTKNEQAISAQVLAADPERDLAVLKVCSVTKLPKPIECPLEPELTETMPISHSAFPTARSLATSKSSPAITIGKGSVSSLRLGDDGELALVQIDGSLNPGNSGGPVVDSQGRLVGVAVATIKNSSGIGLAIPAQVSQMLEGRLGKVFLHASRDDDGVLTIQVEAGLIDPFHQIKSVTLRYLDAGRVARQAQAQRAAGRLAGLPHLAAENREPVGRREDTSQEKRHASDHLAPGRLRRRQRQAGRHRQRNGDRRAQGRGGSQDQGRQLACDRFARIARRRLAAGFLSQFPGSTSSRLRGRTVANRKGPERTGGRFQVGRYGPAIYATLKLDWIKPQKPHPEVPRPWKWSCWRTAMPLRSHAARLLKTWGTPQSIPCEKSVEGS